MIVSDRSPPGRPINTGSFGSRPSPESVPTIRMFSGAGGPALSNGVSAFPNSTRPIERTFP